MATLRGAAGALGLTGRAVHMKIHPRPANLGESREVLRILERFGEVVYFKNLRYENHDPAPNTTLAIYSKESDAQKFLDASPLFFTLEPLAEHRTALSPRDDGGIASEFDRKMEMGKEGAEEMITPGKLTNPSLDDQGSRNSSEDSARPESGTLREQHQSQPREFRLVAELSRLDHRTYINRQPFHGSFKVKTRNLVQEDLAKTVPLVGLSDLDMWRPEVQSRFVRSAQAKREDRMSLRRVWQIGMGQMRREDVKYEARSGEGKAILERMTGKRASRECDKQSGWK